MQAQQVNEPVIIKALFRKHGHGKVKGLSGTLDHYPVGEKCNAIINWARNKNNFDLDFVNSVYSKYSETGLVTFKQEESINNIIEACAIDVSHWS
jgi:hypothetical protein